MKAVILAGGFGTRISEESHLRPKPMIEIGGKPILWHIMKWYSRFGINEFIICAGYKQDVIKEWFANYFLHTSDVTFDFTNGNEVIVHSRHAEPWKVTVVDTGLNTMTGGRVKRIQSYVGNEAFCLTYGDGVSDVDITALIEFHRKNGHVATLTGIVPDGRFGVLDLDGDSIMEFREKSKEDMGRINGGFMVLEPQVFNYIEGDDTVLERGPLESLARIGQLDCYKHDGFWQCMDTLRDKEKLEKMIADGNAPWLTK
jgi:glucose-1-phosphate cytidylyltransferase